jgi:hypothetical protein
MAVEPRHPRQADNSISKTLGPSEFSTYRDALSRLAYCTPCCASFHASHSCPLELS